MLAPHRGTALRRVSLTVLLALLVSLMVGCGPRSYLAPGAVTKVTIKRVGGPPSVEYSAGDSRLLKMVDLYNRAERVSAPTAETTEDYTVAFWTRDDAVFVVFSFGSPVMAAYTPQGAKSGMVSKELQELAREATK